jgi:hypothetical protein
VKLTATIFIFVLASICWGTELPNAPTPVEHDPGAWAVTTAFATVLPGAFTKPSYGLAIGVGVAVFGNLQDSTHAHQNMVGGIGGAVAGYIVIKTLRHDWHRGKQSRFAHIRTAHYSK